jgi:hypothetical protein
MAARNMSVDTDPTTALDALVTLAEYNASEDSPLSIDNIAAELDIPNHEVVTLLDSLEDLKITQYESIGGIFHAWITVEGVTPTTAPDVYAKATGKTVRKAVKPVQGKDGKNVTVPVSEGSTERRELDASQGERVLSEDSMQNLTQDNEGENMETTVIRTGGWENTTPETHFVPYDKDNVTGHMVLPEPGSIPEPPKGVNPNFWELAYTASTLPARKHWYAKCIEQHKAYKEEEVKVAETTKVEDKPREIDPETGLVAPF